ncbi:MAG: hypothetical protein V3R90_09010, partial [Limibaculum sp.]
MTNPDNTAPQRLREAKRQARSFERVRQAGHDRGTALAPLQKTRRRIEQQPGSQAIRARGVDR